MLRRSAGATRIRLRLFVARYPDLEAELAPLGRSGGPDQRPRREQPAESSIPWFWVILAFVLLRLVVKVAQSK